RAEYATLGNLLELMPVAMNPRPALAQQVHLLRRRTVDNEDVLPGGDRERWHVGPVENPEVEMRYCVLVHRAAPPNCRDDGRWMFHFNDIPRSSCQTPLGLSGRRDRLSPTLVHAQA